MTARNTTEGFRPKPAVFLTPLARPLPKLGLGTANHGSPLPAAKQGRLARLGLNRLRVDFHFSQSGWEALKQAQWVELEF